MYSTYKLLIAQDEILYPLEISAVPVRIFLVISGESEMVPSLSGICYMFKKRQCKAFTPFILHFPHLKNVVEFIRYLTTFLSLIFRASPNILHGQRMFFLYMFISIPENSSFYISLQHILVHNLSITSHYFFFENYHSKVLLINSLLVFRMWRFS